MRAEVERLTRERNEARGEVATILAERDGAVSIGTQLSREVYDWASDNERLTRERDEARQEVAELKKQRAALPGWWAECDGARAELEKHLEFRGHEGVAIGIARLAAEHRAEVERLKRELDNLKAPRCLTDKEAANAAAGGQYPDLPAVARAAERKLVGALLGWASKQSPLNSLDVAENVIMAALTAIGAPAAEPAQPAKPGPFCDHLAVRMGPSSCALDRGHAGDHATCDGYRWSTEPAQPEPAASAVLSDEALLHLYNTGGLHAVQRSVVSNYRARLTSEGAVEAACEMFGVAFTSQGPTSWNRGNDHDKSFTRHEMGKAITAAIAHADGAGETVAEAVKVEPKPIAVATPHLLETYNNRLRHGLNDDARAWLYDLTTDVAALAAAINDLQEKTNAR